MFESHRNRLSILAGVALALACRPTPAHTEEDPSPRPQWGPSTADLVSIASSRVLIWPQTVPGSAPFTHAELWHTSDRGRSWHRSPTAPAPPGEGGSSRTTSHLPVTFDAESDGLYGFYLVLHNAAGASAPPPDPGTAPHTWVRVDRSAPIVQILTFRPDEHFELNREIQIRWTVRDDNLPDRPVKLHYRTRMTRSFIAIVDLLPTDSSYRWTVPANESGRIEVKISAVDRAGNAGRYVTDRLEIDPRTGLAAIRPPAAGREDGAISGLPGLDTSVRRGAVLRDSTTADPADPPEDIPALLGRRHRDPPAAAKSIDAGAAKRAKELYDLGTWHRLRGEYAVAIARFREASRLEPNSLQIRNDLAGVLFLHGRHEEAEKEFRRVLADDPMHRSALKSLALVEASRRNYQSSHEALQRLVTLSPEDAEAWLYLGDVTMFMGNRQGARKAWRKVGALETASDELQERAAKRLAIYRRGED